MGKKVGEVFECNGITLLVEIKREEEVNKAAFDYADALEFSNPETRFGHEDIEFAFQRGAEWADNHPINVWNDASDEPVKDTHILIETTIFKDSLEYYSCHWSTLIYQSWEEYVKLYNVKRWTYI